MLGQLYSRDPPPFAPPSPSPPALCLATGALSTIEDVEGLSGTAKGRSGYQGRCAVGGLIGADGPASSSLTSWARRRSGFMPLSAGVMVPACDPNYVSEEAIRVRMMGIAGDNDDPDLSSLRPWHAAY